MRLPESKTNKQTSKNSTDKVKKVNKIQKQSCPKLLITEKCLSYLPSKKNKQKEVRNNNNPKKARITYYLNPALFN